MSGGRRPPEVGPWSVGYDRCNDPRVNGVSSAPVLPLDRLSKQQLSRLAGGLRAAHQAGADLGSRRAHIHAGSGALQKLAAELRLAVERLATGVDAGDLAAMRAIASLWQYIEGVERLAALAAGVPGDPGYFPAPQVGTSTDR